MFVSFFGILCSFRTFRYDRIALDWAIANVESVFSTQKEFTGLSEVSVLQTIKLSGPGVLTIAILATVSIQISAAQPETSGFVKGGWGTLTGRIIFDGVVPETRPLEITRDQEVCGQHSLKDESLMVHSENQGIRYVAVWLDVRETVPVHPDLQKLPEELPLLDNRNCRFEPRMLAIRTGQPLKFSNSDPVAHNAAVYTRRNQPFSEIIPAEPIQKKFSKPELLPVRVDCSIHAWMKGWILIHDHPYAAVTDENGRFEIRNLPAGTWKFRFWQEIPGNLIALKQNGAPVPIEKGVWTLDIPETGTIDLGDLKAAGTQFVSKKK